MVDLSYQDIAHEISMGNMLNNHKFGEYHVFRKKKVGSSYMTHGT